jgi:hypothetical protein
MAFIVIFIGVLITLGSFGFGLYNMYQAFTTEEDIKGMFQRHVLAMAGLAVGGVITMLGFGLLAALLAEQVVG